MKFLHQSHLRFLADEVFKSMNKLNPDFMSDYFAKKSMPYNLSCWEVLSLPKANQHSNASNELVDTKHTWLGRRDQCKRKHKPSENKIAF